MRSEAIETVCSNGVALRVEFAWRGDRIAHVISAVEPAGRIRPLLESIEGTPADNWPPSPPLQSVGLETLPDGRRVALLVGMASGSHWSASVEPIADTAALLFDIACRHSKQPNWLGSRYRQLPGQPKSVVISGDQAAVTTQLEIIAIQPTSHPASTGTTRWRYITTLNPEP